MKRDSSNTDAQQSTYIRETTTITRETYVSSNSPNWWLQDTNSSCNPYRSTESSTDSSASYNSTQSTTDSSAPYNSTQSTTDSGTPYNSDCATTASESLSSVKKESRYTPFTVDSRGTNSQGNSYDNRTQPCGPGYHYPNQDGSYYYKNGDSSTYHNDGNGRSTYKTPDGRVYTKGQ